MFAAIADFARLARAVVVLAREGALAPIDPDALPPGPGLAVRLLRLIETKPAADQATRLSAALNRLGPSYVKLGQFLATRPDVVGQELAADLERLRDRLPPFPRREAERIVELELGQPLGALFESFGEPVAAASIAQVHRARIRGGGASADVAVKVLRPGVERRFAQDLRSFYRAARFLVRFHRPSRRLRPVAVVHTLARSVALEMDFRLEAAAIAEMAENTAGDPDFRTPKIDWTRTARRVLVIEWIDGTPLGEPARLAAEGHDLKLLAATIIQSFLRHAMRDGFFHADMHQGNLFIDPAGRLVAGDFGIMGRLTPRERRFLAEILYGFIRRDYRRVAEVHFEAGYVPADQPLDAFAQALRSIGEPLQDRPAREISMARVLTQLFEVTELFNMQTRPELLLLQKTMVVVEGVGRTLDPDLNMWAVADPVVREWMTRYLGPRGQIDTVGRSAEALRRLVFDLPERVLQIERSIEDLLAIPSAGIRIDPGSIEALAAAYSRRLRQAVVLWIIGLALAAIAVALVL